MFLFSCFKHPNQAHCRWKVNNEGMQSKKFVLQDVRVKPLNIHGPNPSLREVNRIPSTGVASTDANQQTDSNPLFGSLLVVSVS